MCQSKEDSEVMSKMVEELDEVRGFKLGALSCYYVKHVLDVVEEKLYLRVSDCWSAV